MPKNYAPDLLHDTKSSVYGISHQVINESIDMKSMHYHAHYEILYIYQNERILSCENKTYQLNKNSIALIPPYILHKTYSGYCFPQSKFMINFTADFISKINQSLNIDIIKIFNSLNPVISLSDSDADCIISMMQSISSSFNPANPYDEQIFLCKLIALLTFLSKNVSPETSANNITEKITKYLQQNYTQKLTLQDIADKFFISKYQVSRLFTNQIGVNFVDYLSRIRVENAKTMLTNSTLSIQSISEMTGFQSPTDFTRVFKSLLGISPMQYRKANSGVSSD